MFRIVPWCKQKAMHAQTINAAHGRTHSSTLPYLTLPSRVHGLITSIANFHMQPTVSGSTASGLRVRLFGPTPVHLLRRRLITRFGDDFVGVHKTLCALEHCLTAKVVSCTAPTLPPGRQFFLPTMSRASAVVQTFLTRTTFRVPPLPFTGDTTEL